MDIGLRSSLEISVGHAGRDGAAASRHALAEGAADPGLGRLWLPAATMRPQASWPRSKDEYPWPLGRLVFVPLPALMSPVAAQSLAWLGTLLGPFSLVVSRSGRCPAWNWSVPVVLQQGEPDHSLLAPSCS